MGYTTEQLVSIAGGFEAAIRSFSSDHADEIEGIAEGAGIQKWCERANVPTPHIPPSANSAGSDAHACLQNREAYILNARTEIMQAATMSRPAEGPTECTALYSSSHAVLAQNWDWDHTAESMTVFLRVERTDTGRTILQICEPGILGKAGLNDVGVGVTLNILGRKDLHGDSTAGVPVHVLLRAVLEQDSVEQAIACVERAPKHYGCQSCFIIGDDKGSYAILEINGEVVDVARQAEPPVHTNHYCGLGGVGVISNASQRNSTTARYDRACALIEQVSDLDVDAVKGVLRDHAESDWPVNVPWAEDPRPGGMRVGTVTAVVMDMAERKMYATPGSPRDYDFVELSL